MKLKGLSLKMVAAEAQINVSVACQLLNGRRSSPLKLKQLRVIIERSAMPSESATIENAR